MVDRLAHTCTNTRTPEWRHGKKKSMEPRPVLQCLLSLLILSFSDINHCKITAHLSNAIRWWVFCANTILLGNEPRSYSAGVLIFLYPNFVSLNKKNKKTSVWFHFAVPPGLLCYCNRAEMGPEIELCIKERANNDCLLLWTTVTANLYKWQYNVTV